MQVIIFNFDENIFVFPKTLCKYWYVFNISYNLSQRIFILNIYMIFAEFYLLFMIWQRLTAVMHIGYINDQIHYH